MSMTFIHPEKVMQNPEILSIRDGPLFIKGVAPKRGLL